MTKNVYIHIPFCKSKCKYCSFISFPALDLKERYLDSLRREIVSSYRHEKLDTLYFGGGTPSLLNAVEFKRLLDLFEFDKNTEVTVELNPETITLEYLMQLKDLGVNRLSFGCQSFDDDILNIIGRRHTSSDVENAVKIAEDCGFTNVSLDFIYGLPSQTIKGFSDDLEHALSLGVQHISLYGLKIDEGCYFYKHIPENLPDDDMQADMYLKAIGIMKNNGFEHYEISNFSKPGYNSRHNLHYWDNGNYYGFGLAAHGYDDGTRYFNTSDLSDYIKNPLVHKGEHKLTKQEQLEEEIFLGFRKMSGINVEEINRKFGIDFSKKYAQTLDKYLSYKYLSETNTGFKLTDSGILISNVILSDFLQ